MFLTIRYIKTVVIDTDTNQIVSCKESVESENGSSMDFKSSSSVTKKKPSTKKVVEDNGKVTLLDGKLILTPSIVDKINAEVGDRIAINYVSKGDDYVPVISKSNVFGDSEAGNKLTKTLTVSFKGKQCRSLEQYGKEFDLQKDDSLSEGVYFLVDPNFKGLETIKEDNLIKIEPKSITITPENLISNYTEENLEDSENNITFDFSFDTI